MSCLTLLYTAPIHALTETTNVWCDLSLTGVREEPIWGAADLSPPSVSSSSSLATSILDAFLGSIGLCRPLGFHGWSRCHSADVELLALCCPACVGQYQNRCHFLFLTHSRSIQTVHQRSSRADNYDCPECCELRDLLTNLSEARSVFRRRFVASPTTHNAKRSSSIAEISGALLELIKAHTRCSIA